MQLQFLSLVLCEVFALSLSCESRETQQAASWVSRAVTCWAAEAGTAAASRAQPPVLATAGGWRTLPYAPGPGKGGRALECGLPGRGRLCTGVETSWGGVSPVPSAPPPGPLPSAFCELSELSSEVSRGRSLAGRQGQWKKAKARNVSRTCLPPQTADRCPNKGKAIFM